MKSLLYSRPFFAVYDNSIDPYIPEFWANESLAILEEYMVIGNLVHRDFEPIFQNFGDVVNTRRPSEFEAYRKGVNDNVVVQDANATNIPVPLDQLIHVSFMIRDGEQSYAMKDLVTEYMAPAMLAQARFVDRLLLGQAYRFMPNMYGHNGGINAGNSTQYITGVRNILNQNKAYMNDRNLILAPNTETALLNNTNFTAANLVGDDGTALREASLGRKFGFDIFMCQNTPSVATGNTTKAGAINSAPGYPAGTTVLTTNSFTGAVTTGAWLTVAGDDTPQRITAHSEGGGNTTSITISPGLKYAVANAAVVTSYVPGAVNNGGGYPAGYSKSIIYNTFTVDPQVGQLVSFGAGTDTYSIVRVDTVNKTITLDRPLAAAINNTDVIGVGPPGDYNFAFHRNAIALVNRPLAPPRDGIGARSAVVNLNSLSVRATLSYNGDKQGTLVTLDMLLGVAILDKNLGALMLG